MIESKIREIQLVELDILKQILKICEKYNITYFASYGTLLGVVRHKGFIPWDDDVDLYMPRPDFEKFCEIAEHELQYPYFLQINRTDPMYTQHIIKVQNLKTTFIEVDSSKDQRRGIFVDINALDGTTPYWLHHRYIRFMYKTYRDCMIDWFDHKKYFRKHIKRIYGNLINILFFGNQPHQFFFNLQEELYKKIPYKFAEHVADYHNRRFFNKTIFADKIFLDFEDIQLACPIGYDAFLKQVYGDYMTPPPVNQRVPQHNVVVIDPNKPYTEYLS